MKWLNKLEGKYGHLGVHNLISYIILVKGAAYILNSMDTSGTFLYNIALVPEKVLQGQVWRLFTYIAMPPMVSPMFVIFTFMLMYIYGQGLEHEWGTFKFNLFYLIGFLATIFSTFIGGGFGTTSFLDQSIFWAFAIIYPDFTLRLFFVLPVKIKYLAGISGIFSLFMFVRGPLTTKLAVLVAFINLIIFFGEDMVDLLKHKKRVQRNRARIGINKKSYNEKRVIHKCHVCGLTEQDDPNMSFRYCSTCQGHFEYCMDHLKDHKHVKVQ